MRTANDLLALAGQYAVQRRVPVATVMKEILHYEILFALNQSGAATQLTFQGGTALRLCYQGTRYSEDLDFAGGADFNPQSMAPFSELLQREIAQAYGLKVEVTAPKSKEELDGNSNVAVARWRARIQVPQTNPSLPQKQVINIEVASVPAHQQTLMPVSANYPHLPAPLRQMMVLAESQTEILADKLVALGARPFLKARDIWDIKFLTDKGLKIDDQVVGLVMDKLNDYGVSPAGFRVKLEERLQDLSKPQTESSFVTEMSRFVDTGVATQLKVPGVTRQYLDRSSSLGRALLSMPSFRPTETQKNKTQDKVTPASTSRPNTKK